jgi:hypothetical protein
MSFIIPAVLTWQLVMGGRSSFPIFTACDGNSGRRIVVERDLTNIKRVIEVRPTTVTSREALEGDTRPGDFGSG